MDSSEGLKEIKNKYKKTSGEKIAKIQNLINQMKEKPGKESFSSFRLEVHKISGSAGLYDFHEVSRLCKEMDLIFMKKIEDNERTGIWEFEESLLNDFLFQIAKAFRELD